ncbi:MAG: TOBE domain-containing protein [Bacteroidales bacterium]|nr:TOBE domain-containing protein [Bacteroidales bacterium]
MNKISITITNIEEDNGLLLIDLHADNFHLSALLINTGEKPFWLKPGNKAVAVFKGNGGFSCKNLQGMISLRNKLPCRIEKFEAGKILSLVTLRFGQYTIQSAITSRSAEMLGIKPGEEVLALIKSNEVSLMKE